MMTVSAVERLTPSPPARVDNKKQKSCEPSALKWSMPCVCARRARRISCDRPRLRETATATYSLSLLARHRAVEALEEEVLALEVVAQDVEHAHHLRKDQHSVAGLVQAHQELVQQAQLAAVANQCQTLVVAVAILSSLK